MVRFSSFLLQCLLYELIDAEIEHLLKESKKSCLFCFRKHFNVIVMEVI